MSTNLMSKDGKLYSEDEYLEELSTQLKDHQEIIEKLMLREGEEKVRRKVLENEIAEMSDQLKWMKQKLSTSEKELAECSFFAFGKKKSLLQSIRMMKNVLPELTDTLSRDREELSTIILNRTSEDLIKEKGIREDITSEITQIKIFLESRKKKVKKVLDDEEEDDLLEEDDLF